MVHKVPQSLPNVHDLFSCCFAATNSEPYVAVSTVACFLEYQSTGVLLTKWRHPVRDLPVAKEWFNNRILSKAQILLVL